VSDVRDQLHDAPRDRDDPPTVQVEIQTPHDPLGAYALGALDIGEQRLFELHLFVCAACRTDLAAHQRAVNLLPYALPAMQPPAGARDRLLAQVRGEASESPTVAMPIHEDDESRTAEAPTIAQAAAAPEEAQTVVEAAPVREAGDDGPATVPVRRVQPRRGVQIKLASIGWAAALLIVVASGLFVWVWSATGPHASAEIEILARLPGGQLLGLSGTGAPTASGRLYVVEGGRRAELTVDALPPLNRGRVYQLWFTEPGQPARTGGAFGVDPRGDAVVQVTIPTPLERVRAISVTQEPAPGSPAPSGLSLLNWAP
jgi:anti-sigma-K factor RskA